MGWVDGWTIDTLRVHLAGQIVDLRTMLDERYAAQARAFDTALVAHYTAMRAALESADKAVTKAEEASGKRFDSVNAFRGQLTDQARTFVTRDQYTTAHESLRQMIDLQRAGLADHTAYDIAAQGKLTADLTGLRARYAGVSVALGVIMTVLIVLVTIIELAK
jgi:hypothetical protein